MTKKIHCDFIPLSKNLKKELRSYLEETHKQIGKQDYSIAMGIMIPRIISFLCSEKITKVERLVELCHYFSEYLFNEIMGTVDNSDYDEKTKIWIKKQINMHFQI